MNVHAWLLLFPMLMMAPHVHAQSTESPRNSDGPQNAEPPENSAERPEQATPSDAKELARQRYAEGLALARTGNFLGAKEKFLEAYSAAPHFLVLYNIAQASLELDQPAEAVRYLKRYLAESGGELSEAQAVKVQEQIDRLEREAAATGVPPAHSQRVPRRELATGPSDTDEHSEAAPSVSPGTSASSIKRTAPARRTPSSTKRLSVPSTNRSSVITGYVVSAAGVALLATGGALYLWNNDRYAEWRAEDQALHARQGELLAVGRAPRDNSDFMTRVSKNDERLSAVQTLDVWTLVSVGAGAAALGLGAWFVLGSPNEGQLVATSHSVEWRGTW